jgi:hypothetical protein
VIGFIRPPLTPPEHLRQRLLVGKLVNATDHDQRLVVVLDRLDEVRLAEDEVGIVGLLDLYHLELHVDFLPFCRHFSSNSSMTTGVFA